MINTHILQERGGVKMIEQVKMSKYGPAFTLEQLIKEIALKQDEIIDKINELDIKVHTTKFFTQEQNDAIKKLLDLAGDEKES